MSIAQNNDDNAKRMIEKTYVKVEQYMNNNKS